MFENVLGQSAVTEISRDIEFGRLPPAMLFHGPETSAKGTSALELARYISCESAAAKKAAWNCSCSACNRHRMLLHPDLLCLGSRNFSAEISAAAAAFLRETEAAAAQTLFIRSIRKLLARFNPVLWEDDSKVSKINPMVSSLEEDLDALVNGSQEKAAIEKLVSAITKNALKLEGEGITNNIPIAQIRRSSSWAHLLPSGNGKILIIENADRMQEGPRNSLLKLLEEPPEKVTLILASTKPKTLLPTILSRLRPYRFLQRDEETEKEVIRRIFRNSTPVETDSGKSGLISEYLDSFLPVSAQTIENLAAHFSSSSAKKSVSLLQNNKKSVPETVAALASFSNTEKSGSNNEAASVISAVMKGAEGFDAHYLFPRFLQTLLKQVSEANRMVSLPSPAQIGHLHLWKKCCTEAESAVSIYNQSISAVLERLFTETSRGMAGL